MAARAGRDGLLRLLLVSAVAGLLAGAASAQAAWPGANGMIAFEHYTAEANSLLATVRPHVRGSRRILSRPPAWCRDPYWSDERPRWSRDGNWIAYVHEDDCRDRTAFQRQVRVIRPDGTGMRIVRRFGEEAPARHESGHHPVFTADGRRLLLTISHSRVWVLGARSGRRVRVLRFPKGRIIPPLSYSVFAHSPQGRTATLRLSPRGRRRPNTLAGSGLYAGRFGGRWRRLTRPRQTRRVASFDTAPDWHPSGRALIFERYRVCAGPDCPIPEDGVSDVFEWRAGRTRRLSRGGLTETPVYSPDGTSWVASFPNDKLCVRRLGSRRRLWCGAPGGLYPDWQPVTADTVYR